MAIPSHPLPWSFEGDRGPYSGSAVVVMDVKRRVICGAPSRKAAAFIVRACNAHDELVEAANRLVVEVRGNATFPELRAAIGNTNVACLLQAADDLSAALAKAKGVRT